MKAILLVALILGAASAAEISQSGPASASRATTTISSHSKANCETIVKEIKRQQGSVFAQNFLGRFVAWKESGCSMQCVKDSDDLSCSRFGINFKGRGMGDAWGRLCNAWSRVATKNLSTDVRCALRALAKFGTRPWRN